MTKYSKEELEQFKYQPDITYFHMINRQCTTDQFENRKKDLEDAGYVFESAFFELADKSDPHPHVHSIVTISLLLKPKTIRDRMRQHKDKKYAYLKGLLVCKAIDDDYGNLLKVRQYICKDWNAKNNNPLIWNEIVDYIYTPLMGQHAFNKKFIITSEGEKVPKLSFNIQIKNDFTIYFESKNCHVKDDEILDWLMDTYRCFTKDIDPNILARKFWYLKNLFKIHDKHNLKRATQRVIDSQCGLN